MLQAGYYNMDCMLAMKDYPDNYFDIAVCDPPYGIGISGQKLYTSKTNRKHNRKEHKDHQWDQDIPSAEYFRELERISKHQIIFGGNYFVEHLNKGTKGWIVWDKGQYGLSMSDCELIYTSFQRPTRIVKINRGALAVDGTIHPTQKPLKLYDWIFQNYAAAGQRMIDTHAGSASSLISAYENGIEFTGFEKNKEIWQTSNERLQRYTSQMTIYEFLT